MIETDRRRSEQESEFNAYIKREGTMSALFTKFINQRLQSDNQRCPQAESSTDSTEGYPGGRGHLQLMEEDEDDSLNAIKQETQVRVAIDSGSCRNVTHPKALPSGVKVDPNTTGKHLSGAGGEVIEKYGECMTSIAGTPGKFGC